MVCNNSGLVTDRLICNNSGLEVMVAGASEDTGFAKERRRLAVPTEEVADERDEMVLENLQFKPLPAPRRACIDIITASSFEAWCRGPSRQREAFLSPQQVHWDNHEEDESS